MNRLKIEGTQCILCLSERELDYFENRCCSDVASTTTLILNNLIENEFAERNGVHLAFDIGVLYDVLTDYDLKILKLPLISEYKLFVRNINLLNHSDFSFVYEYFTFMPLGEKIDIVEVDGIFEANGIQFIPTKSQREVIELINRHSIGENTFERNIEFLAKIKKVVPNNELFFNPYLENEHAIFPSSLKLSIRDDGSFIPMIDDSCNQKFQKAFDLYPNVLSNYSTQPDNGNKRVRVVVGDTFNEPLKTIKKVNKSRDIDEIKQIVNSPKEYFDLDLIDVSEFYSDRVVEIGFYKPKVSKFISPYKSEWLPGIILNYNDNEKARILVESEEQLEELSRTIEEAIVEDRAFVVYNEITLPIESAQDLVDFARKQFESKTPIEEFNGEKIVQNKVLIIRDNEECLDYDLSSKIASGGLSNQDVRHHLFEIKNLNEDIKLKSHQVEGVAWLQTLYNERFTGCLLADDMGLGKTLQVLYFIEWLGSARDSEEDQKPILIVAPNSLLENWENEYRRFFVNRSYLVQKLIPPFPFNKSTNDPLFIEFMQHRQILLMTYETLRHHQLSIAAVDFRLVILDEAQRIKTPGRIVTNAAKSIKSKFKIAISGTPVENSLIDLWCIADFFCPGHLGTARSFCKKYVHSLREKAGEELVALGEELRREIGILLKRRLKKDVAKDLPLKLKSNNESDKEHFDRVNIVREMPDEQLAIYKHAIRNKNQSTDKNDMLAYINRIKEVSDHPYIDLEDFLQKGAGELIRSSSKLQSTFELLENIKNRDEKVLIFAERRNIQQMLQKVIIERFGFTPSIINGDTPSVVTRSKNNFSRQSVIDRFSEKYGFNILILSPIAAGVGLNIVAANHVIHYSRHWNPAKEEQATDRAYRIGQNKDVYVYYPMAISREFGSFDIILDELLKSKMSLATHTLFPTEQVEVTINEIYSQL